MSLPLQLCVCNIYVNVHMSVYMKIFPFRGDIKAQRLHPEQGHDGMFYDQLETSQCGLNGESWDRDEFREGTGNRQQRGFAHSCKVPAFTPCEMLAQNSAIVSPGNTRLR